MHHHLRAVPEQELEGVPQRKVLLMVHHARGPLLALFGRRLTPVVRGLEQLPVAAPRARLPREHLPTTARATSAASKHMSAHK